MADRTSKHQDLVKEILIEFGTSDILKFWSNNTGAVKIRNGFIRFGLKGSSDIIGILFDGRFLAIEVKTGKARQTKEQKLFQEMIEKFNGVYILARSKKDVFKRLEKEGYII